MGEIQSHFHWTHTAGPFNRSSTAYNDRRNEDLCARSPQRGQLVTIQFTKLLSLSTAHRWRSHWPAMRRQAVTPICSLSIALTWATNESTAAASIGIWSSTDSALREASRSSLRSFTSTAAWPTESRQ